MRNVNQTRPLTDFQRDTTEHIRRLKATGEPEVLTVNGEPELVVQSADAYEQLAKDAEFARHMKALRKSLAEADRGEGRPARDVMNEIAQEHGFELGA